jgi:hypothetical protein
MNLFWLPYFCYYVLSATPVSNECFKGSSRDIYISWNRMYLITFYNISTIQFLSWWIFTSMNINVYLGTQPSCTSYFVDEFWEYAYFNAIRLCSPISHPLFHNWDSVISEYPHSPDKTFVPFGASYLENRVTDERVGETPAIMRGVTISCLYIFTEINLSLFYCFLTSAEKRCN